MTSQPSNDRVFEVKFGGYYANKEGDHYSVMRLLDLDQDSYHISIFSKNFDRMPTMDDIRNLRPFLGHAPMDARQLVLGQCYELIGAEPLTKEDLEGYCDYYLEAMGAPQDCREAAKEKLIQLSQQPAVKLRLGVSQENGTLTITNQALVD